MAGALVDARPLSYDRAAVTAGVPGTMPPHGNYSRYQNHGCRCDRCREAATTYAREWRHRTGYALPREDYLLLLRRKAELRDNHGTETRYKFGCRCDVCKAAAAQARRDRRNFNRTPPTVHGTHAGYSNGCRCDACRAATNAYRREWRRRERVV